MKRHPFQSLQPLETRVLCSRALAGDANHDNVVDVLDHGIVAAGWQRPTNRGDFGGDLNGDGRVDILDLGLIANNWQVSITAPLYDFHWQGNHVWIPDPANFGEAWNAPAPDSLYGADGIPSIESIQQSPYLANCWFLAGEGALAAKTPDAIKNAITWDGFGWAVTFRIGSGPLSSSNSVVVHIKDTLSVWLQANTGETWAYLMEKAAAWFRFRQSDYTLNSLDWGQPYDALKWFSNGLYSFTSIQSAGNAANAGKPVCFNTPPITSTLVASHSYVVIGQSGSTWTLYNPWGFYVTIDSASLYPQVAGGWAFTTQSGATHQKLRIQWSTYAPDRK